MRNTCSASTGSRPWPAIVRLSAPPRIAPAAAIVARISACPMADGIGGRRHAHVGVDGRLQAVLGADAAQRALPGDLEEQHGARLDDERDRLAGAIERLPRRHRQPLDAGPDADRRAAHAARRAPLAAPMRQRRGRRRAEILAPGVRRDADAVADVPRQRARRGRGVRGVAEIARGSPPSTPRPAPPGRSRRAAAAGDRRPACQPWPPACTISTRQPRPAAACAGFGCTKNTVVPREPGRGAASITRCPCARSASKAACASRTR